MGNQAAINKGAFRIKDWWGKAALLMGMVYLFAARYNIAFGKFIPLCIWSLVTIAGFASTGYLLNDLFDLEKDALAGKRNFIAGKPLSVIVLLFIASAAFVLLPWWFLPKTAFSFVLIGVQILLFILYSAPPVRLKERGLAGIVTDSLYAHGVPAFLAVYTFALAAGYDFPTTDVFVLFAWQTMAGVRNILVHQADDAEADRKSGSNNYVAKMQASKTAMLLNIVRTTELLLCILFFSILTFVNPLFWVCLVLVLVLCTVFWLFEQTPVLQFLRGNPRFFPNNVYEKWLPVAYLALLSVYDFRFAVLLVVHVALFAFAFYVQLADRIYGVWKSIPFKGYLINVRIFLSYPINYFIYYLLKIFAIDLKKENISAFGYLSRLLGLKQSTKKDKQ